MATGLLALLDDIVAIAKLAASQIDDVAAQAAKVGSKSAGVIIDDAAVTPKYVSGLPAARELPIVAKIARGSLFNKLVILLPALLLLQAVAPSAIAPILMLGGAYLCFEGAEKIWHALRGHHEPGPQRAASLDAAHLEERRVKGAIKTDFILSAEIMTISLAAIDADSARWARSAAVLALVAGVAITAGVYGAVALIVKADDAGVALAANGIGGPFGGLTRAFGRGLVKFMPYFLKALATIGTAAMVWVGGGIIVHGLAQYGFADIDISSTASRSPPFTRPPAAGAAEWSDGDGLGVVGLAVDAVTIRSREDRGAALDGAARLILVPERSGLARSVNMSSFQPFRIQAGISGGEVE